MRRNVARSADAAAAVADLLRFEPDIAFRRRARTIVEYLDAQPGERIFDAGCGMGFQLHLLARLTESELYGLEFSADRLAHARADEYAGRARLFVGDVTRLPVRDGAFDKVVFSEVLEHVPDDRAAIGEVFRVLRPGGVCAITVPNASYPWLWDPINGTRERLGLGHFKDEPWSGIWTDHQRLYTREEVTALVESAGFRLTDVHLETRYAVPFTHNIIYGLGKFLVERNLAGKDGGERASRFSVWGQGKLTPLRLAILAFTAVDRFNKPRYETGPALNICLRAVKPG
jgi:ubiquinone/menaquinone biosynthesis C-methylase UbiE